VRRNATQVVMTNPVPQKISTILEFFSLRLTNQSKPIKLRMTRPRLR